MNLYTPYYYSLPPTLPYPILSYPHFVLCSLFLVLAVAVVVPQATALQQDKGSIYVYLDTISVRLPRYSDSGWID